MKNCGNDWCGVQQQPEENNFTAYYVKTPRIFVVKNGYQEESLINQNRRKRNSKRGAF